MGKSPAFRFYPGDFMASPDVQSMDLNEVGAYTLLLCIAWQQDRHGYLPDDENKLRRWARMSPEQWATSREMLMGKFPVVEPGLRANIRMIREAEKQAEFSAKQSGNGRLGGRPKKALGLGNKAVGLEVEPKRKPNITEIKPSVSVFVSASVSEAEQKLPQRANTLALTSHEVHAGIFELPLIGNQGEWSVPEDLYREMVKAYPGVSVMEQLGKMRAWLIARPTKRKTRSGLPKFINSWLSRAQDDQPKHAGGSNLGKPNRIDAILESTNATLTARRNRGLDGEADSDGGGPHPVTTARSLFERPHAQFVAKNLG